MYHNLKVNEADNSEESIINDTEDEPVSKKITIHVSWILRIKKKIV